jgi:hypothetical protein
MSPSDTTAVNPRDDGSDKAARMLTPDPMKPHSIYDAQKAPKQDPGAEEAETVTSRR